jgi:ketosteroid isomerase-like protein
MKPALLILLVVFFFSGCARQEPVQMTVQEQDVAKKEIREVADHLLQSLNTMDVEALLQPYWNSPDFALVSTDGSMADYQTAKNGTVEMFKLLASLKYTTSKDEFRFLPGNTVIYAWFGKSEFAFKTGEQSKIDAYAITFVLRKIDNNWKIVYAHESASPPVE